MYRETKFKNSPATILLYVFTLTRWLGVFPFYWKSTTSEGYYVRCKNAFLYSFLPLVLTTVNMIFLLQHRFVSTCSSKSGETGGKGGSSSQKINSERTELKAQIKKTSISCLESRMFDKWKKNAHKSIGSILAPEYNFETEEIEKLE